MPAAVSRPLRSTTSPPCASTTRRAAIAGQNADSAVHERRKSAPASASGSDGSEVASAIFGIEATGAVTFPGYELLHVDFGEIAHAPPGFHAGAWRELFAGDPSIANYLFYPQPTTMIATTLIEPGAA